MSTKLRLGLVTLAMALTVSPSAGQQRVSRDRTPGWIGIEFELSSDRRGRSTVVRITDVVPGSPADEAGLRPGDRLLSVNDLDRTSELAELSERLDLSAGERVRISIERDGRRRQVRLRAAERPNDFTAATTLELSFEPDSMVETLYRAMDSVRIRVVQSRGQNTRFGTSTGGGDRVTVVSGSGGQSGGVRAPFEFFVFQGEEHDSLRQEMVELNEMVAELQLRISGRTRELQTRTGSGRNASSVQDRELERLAREMEEASRRSAVLQTRMAESARATAGFPYASRSSEAAWAPATVARASAGQSGEFRPLTPYILGRNRVAGAEVIDLRPELASYFEGVEGGVLVADVAPGTPAAISGIIPGDVITRMDRVAVRSVEDLRFGVSQAGDTLPLTLIRRGTTLQVLLRR